MFTLSVIVFCFVYLFFRNVCYYDGNISCMFVYVLEISKEHIFVIFVYSMYFVDQ
jgi:hypothetical protein